MPDTTVIIALIALIGDIALGILQWRDKRSKAEKEANERKAINEAEKIDVDSTSVLIDRALSISRQEVETLRIVMESLKQELDEKIQEITLLKKEIEEKDKVISDLKNKIGE